jgi:hypothetical protein
LESLGKSKKFSGFSQLSRIQLVLQLFIDNITKKNTYSIMGNSSNSKTHSKTAHSIMHNPTSQQDSHVCLESLELTGKDTSEIIASKLQKCQTKSVSILKFSKVNITNETLELCSKFVNPIQLCFYQCTFVKPEINLEKYLRLKDLILTFTYGDSLNLKILRIKSCKGFNMWKFMDSALVEIP